MFWRYIKIFNILALALLVKCEAIGDGDYPDYNYEYPNSGDNNVKTTSLVIFYASDLLWFWYKVDYNLVPPPGWADPHRETELDILQSQPWSAALSFWFVFFFFWEIFSKSRDIPIRSRDYRISDRSGSVEVYRYQVRPSQSKVTLQLFHPVLTSTLRWRTSVSLWQTSRKSCRTKPSRHWVRRTRTWRRLTAVGSLTGGGERTTFLKIKGGESRKISERKTKFNYMSQLWCIRLF